MSSPAERFAQARRTGAAAHPRLREFASSLDFPLDDFQQQGCAALEDGRSVLVAAPTGAGKTVVGEFAVALALRTARKAFYTTPIKALSNQKYADLVAQHGSRQVGLLTGDASINSEAPIVVMTTEVLRNMMYAGSATLAGLGYVVMDEVHYLADRFRGAVWEEVIIHLPTDVLLVSLSATVSNAEEFGAWLGEVRGDTEVVVSEHRPVPLWQDMLVGRDLYDLFVDPGDSAAGTAAERGHRDVEAMVNPDLLEAIGDYRAGTDSRGRRDDAGAPRGRRGRQRRGGAPDTRGTRPQAAHYRGGGGSGGYGRRDITEPDRGPQARRGGLAGRAEVIERLDREGLLPAITFIFSRAGCEAAVSQLLSWNTRLISVEEGEQIHRLVESRVAALASQDLAVLGFWDFTEGLTRGFAAHHAGMLPVFREIVEELFTAGRIRAVFATETLALGINMPARTVVLEKLVKYNGEAHASITPAEYTQLTGRAGRRGIDIEGHAVVLWNPQLDPLAVAGLASTRTFPLRSSFRPTYNMAVNLVAQFGREPAREVLETSFAQFQADRAVVGLARQIREHDKALAGYAESMTCHLGDFTEYADLREKINSLEKGAAKARSASRRAEVELSLQGLTPGDVVWCVDGRREGRAVVVGSGGSGGRARSGGGRGAEPAVITQDGRLRRLDAVDLGAPLQVIGRLTLPRHVNLRNPKERRDLAATLRARIPDVRPEPAPRDLAQSHRDVEHEVAELRRQAKDHPCHRCPDRENHARWAQRWHRLNRETETLRRKMSGRTDVVARTFDRICTVLSQMGYLTHEGDVVTPDGQRLRRLYSEKDLLTAECLRRGVWARLDAPGLAAVVSCLVHEPRREERDPTPPMPTDAVARAHDDMVRIWSALEDTEQEHCLTLTGYPDPGLALTMHRWAGGATLDAVLRDSDLAAGDFVRRCKQVVDLLDQIASVAAQPSLQRTARSALDQVMRGVVAADRPA